jgi:aspartate carbamoyltransferase catalytic subunit
MLELGGSVLGFASADSSSASKGESVDDTVRVVGNYADIVAMRHPKEGAPIVAARKASIPVVNAGDGGHNHPTQTLADLLTIQKEKGRLDNLVVGMCGDLKFGRTVHSLTQALSRHKGIRFVFISPHELRIPNYLRQGVLLKKNLEFTEIEGLEQAIGGLDVLYMTRIQRERFANQENYERLKDSYVLDNQKLTFARPDLAILHPLPRVGEIAQEVDGDPRVCYFRQTLYGKYMRMALILWLLSEAGASGTDASEASSGSGAGGAGEGRDDASGTDASEASSGSGAGGANKVSGVNGVSCVDKVSDTDMANKTNTLPESLARFNNAVQFEWVFCANMHCITTTEPHLKQLFYLADEDSKTYRCVYCEASVDA